MKPYTIVVIGGGHAGLHAVAHLKNRLADHAPDRYNIVLIDKNPYHTRKVMLFKAAVHPISLHIPFSDMFGDSVRFIQGSVTTLDPISGIVQIETPVGEKEALPYDRLVLALGSVVREMPEEKGGISLTSPQKAEEIRLLLKEQIVQAAAEKEDAQKQRHLTVSVVGAGLSGIETAAQIGEWLGIQAEKAGLNPALAKVNLINAEERLFPQAPPKVGKQLEKALGKLGVNVFHKRLADRFEDGYLHLSNGTQLPCAVCIWATGTLPNPLLAALGLPLSVTGRVLVDASYRVRGMKNVYALGDCAEVTDPITGRVDPMTCKDALPQAQRLSRVIEADILGKKAPAHRTSKPELKSIGLGNKQGLLWIKAGKIDFVFTGRIMGKWKSLVWDMSSLLDKFSRRKFRIHSSPSSLDPNKSQLAKSR